MKIGSTAQRGYIVGYLHHIAAAHGLSAAQEAWPATEARSRLGSTGTLAPRRHCSRYALGRAPAPRCGSSAAQPARRVPSPGPNQAGVGLSMNPSAGCPRRPPAWWEPRWGVHPPFLYHQPLSLRAFLLRGSRGGRHRSPMGGERSGRASRPARTRPGRRPPGPPPRPHSRREPPAGAPMI
jgi:hypothetical protein